MIKALAVFLSLVCASFGATINTGGAGGGSGDVTQSGANAFTNINSYSGATVLVANAMGALAVDVTKGLNTKTVAADSTFTFSGTPATTNTNFSLLLTNSDTNPHVITIPSSFSLSRQAAITSFVIPASGKAWLFWKYNGSVYDLTGETPPLDNFAATAAPTVNEDTADGYSAGSLWLDTTNHKLYQAETVALGAAAWVEVAMTAATQTLTNKTIDSASNVVKFYTEEQFEFPDQVDNTGTTRVSTEGATYGTAKFSNSADQAANYAIFRWRVPADLDTATDLTAALTFRLSAADTAKHRYVISMADVTSSAGADSPTFSNAINLDFTGDASGASGDIEQIAATTLTTWRSSLTAGHLIVVKLARDGDDGTNDTSTVDSNLSNLTVKVFHSQ